MKLFQLFAYVVVALQLTSGLSADDKCGTTNLYECPSVTCNSTILVKDCLDCDGFFSTDPGTGTCFDRKLVNGTDNPSSDYLWRDIVGLILWFCTAGIATACGVGGGGVYVPVGILLLNFAPKASSGLSQASIFGASLGGLLLNIRDNHPFTTKSTTKQGTTKMESCEMAAPADSDKAKYYTRPLIDFDMALFLSPVSLVIELSLFSTSFTDFIHFRTILDGDGGCSIGCNYPKAIAKCKLLMCLHMYHSDEKDGSF